MKVNIDNMSFEELCEALYGKMKEGFDNYKAQLETMTVSEALTHAYEYNTYENVLEMIADSDSHLSQEQVKALLQADDPFRDIYNDWMCTNINYTQEFYDTIIGRANTYIYGTDKF